MTRLSIEPLAPGHDRRHFDCGVHELNYWFRRHARPATAQDDARTYVALDANGTVVGFHALAYGSVERTTAPQWTQTGARYPVPVLILARLAVSSSTQDSGVGKLLLRDAIDRCVQAADIAGLAALLVHAKNDEAAQFYEHHGFHPSPTDGLHLFLTLEEIRLQGN